MCTVTDFVEQVGDIWLTPLFWDCECEDDYIHSASEELCYACNMARGESPDSRVVDVLKYADLLSEDLVSLVESAMTVAAPLFCMIPF